MVTKDMERSQLSAASAAAVLETAFDVLIKMSLEFLTSPIHTALNTAVSSVATSSSAKAVQISSTPIYIEAMKSLNFCFVTPLFEYQTHFDALHSYRQLKDGKRQTSSIRGTNNEGVVGRCDDHSSILFICIGEEELKEIDFEENLIRSIRYIRSHYSIRREICIFISVREVLTSYLADTEGVSSIPHLDGKPLLTQQPSTNKKYGSIQYTLSELDDLIALLLMEEGIDCTEVQSYIEAGEYIAKTANSISSGRGKKPISYFKCKPHGCVDKLNFSPSAATWISQLMQVPGISEETAKTIAAKYPSPYHLLQEFASTAGDSDGYKYAALSKLEISSRNGSRKLGVAISKRLYRLYSETAAPVDHVY